MRGKRRKLHTGVDLMATSEEALHGLGWKPQFHLDPCTADPLEARRVYHRLRIQAVIDLVHDELHVTLRLNGATHDAEGADSAPVTRQE